MSLTVREKQIAGLLALGVNRPDIATSLAISLSTVDKMLRSLKDKLGAGSQVELAVKCADFLSSDRPKSFAATQGPLARHADLAEQPTAFASPTDSYPSFATLFSQLVARLKPLGITHITYSHICSAEQSGALRHIATRWSFPNDLAFDFSIPPEQNLAFKHALSSWAPAPLDLEIMAQSELYAYVPENVRAQNKIFIDAGLVRGVTFVLPAIEARDRLVISTVLKNVTRTEFDLFVREKMAETHMILIEFRHAHVALAKPATSLKPREKSVIRLLAEGQSANEIATKNKVSRRVIDRILTDIRSAYGVATNAAAVAAFVKDQIAPKLPF